jgi:hypothetical protein
MSFAVSKTLEELLEIEKSTPRTQERPSAIQVESLKLAEAVFQWRTFQSALASQVAHIKELTRALEASSKPFDPLLVTVVGDDCYVIDGHHRLQAYKEAEWSAPVPVVYFDGSVEEARLEGLKHNVKNKLPMTKDDKFEAAWSLVKEGQKYSKSTISTLTTVAERTVATMRSILREHPEAMDYSWSKAKSLQFDNHLDMEHEEWMDQAAQKMADQILKNLGGTLPKRLDVLARALEKIDDGLPKVLVEEWIDVACHVVQERAPSLLAEYKIDRVRTTTKAEE